jgi:hypothetical protein
MAALTTRCIKPEDFSCVTRGVYTWLIMPAYNQEHILRWPLDGIAPPSAMERRIAALRRAGTEVEYRKYPNFGHGFGPGTGTSAEGWVVDAIRFWERQ